MCSTTVAFLFRLVSVSVALGHSNNMCLFWEDGSLINSVSVVKAGSLLVPVSISQGVGHSTDNVSVSLHGSLTVLVSVVTAGSLSSIVSVTTTWLLLDL